MNHKAANWYGLDHPSISRRDALERDWVRDARGRTIWMNPPYGRAGVPFTAKAVDAARRGATVVCLVPARTDTRWWHGMTFESGVNFEVRFVKGRLRFGDGSGTAPFPSAVIVLGPRARGTWTAMPARLPAAAVDQLALFDLAS